MATTPTQRTIKYLKGQGILCGIVERWIQFGPKDPRKKFMPGQRIDLFGIIDIIAISDTQTIGIQCCAGSGNSAHIKKLMEEKRDMTLAWVSNPNRRLEIHAWRKLVKVRGKKAKHWVPKITVIDMNDLYDTTS